MEKYISNCENDTKNIAKTIAKRLKNGDIIALNGDLGAGKTAFVKGLSEFFNCGGEVSSPTFTLVNEYYGDVTLYHFDVYRLKDLSKDESDWMDDYLFDDGVCVIEWAENVRDILPNKHIKIDILKNYEKGEDYRDLIVKWNE